MFPINNARSDTLPTKSSLEAASGVLWRLSINERLVENKQSNDSFRGLTSEGIEKLRENGKVHR